jgi:glycosyltransferase involved in cell wall biosynthesis
MFTVVIPIFNNEKTIERAINSVLKQKFIPPEILIINDGSTDNSTMVVSKLSDNRIRVIHQKNLGVSVARNTGIQNASNEWIAFLDADDEWESEFLATIHELIIENPGCIGAATAYKVGNILGVTRPIQLRKLEFEKQGVMRNYFEVSLCSNPPVCSSCVCVKKEIIMSIGNFPPGVKAGEDLLTWARLATMGDFAYSTRPLATFWQEESHTYQSTPTRIPDQLDFVGKKLHDLLVSYHGPQRKYLRKYIGLWHKMRASVYLRLGMNKPAFQEIVKAFSNRFYNKKLLAYIFLLLLPVRFWNTFFRTFSK